MGVDPDSPWNPRVPADVTPVEFESLVLAWLKRCAEIENLRIESEHLGVVQGDGGEYEIDVLVKQSLFREAVITILVECKHLTRPVEREDVLVLGAKLQDVGAHKGMLFSTSGFQSGAIKFADKRGIATVTVTDGKWLYMTKALGGRPVEPPPWVQLDPYVGIRIRPSEKGISCQTIDLKRVDALLEWFAEIERKS